MVLKEAQKWLSHYLDNFKHQDIILLERLSDSRDVKPNAKNFTTFLDDDRILLDLITYEGNTLSDGVPIDYYMTQIQFVINSFTKIDYVEERLSDCS